MRQFFLVLPFLFLLAGCQCRQGSPAPMEGQAEEAVDSVFVPVFESSLIPPERNLRASAHSPAGIGSRPAGTRKG